jgi:hypothetical protein
MRNWAHLSDLKTGVDLQPPPILICDLTAAHVFHPLGHGTCNEGFGSLLFSISLSLEPDLGTSETACDRVVCLGGNAAQSNHPIQANKKQDIELIVAPNNDPNHLFSPLTYFELRRQNQLRPINFSAGRRRESFVLKDEVFRNWLNAIFCMQIGTEDAVATCRTISKSVVFPRKEIDLVSSGRH